MKLLGLELAVLLLSLLCCANAFNITKVLDGYPEFSEFNQDLKRTKLADDINSRQTITVLVVSNAGLSSLSGLDPASLKRVLSLHVLLDYFDADKLQQITNGTTLTTSLYQTTGSATGTSGLVNITDLKGGKVAFGVGGGHPSLPATFVKSVQQETYNLSVIEISQPITTTVAEAPAGAPPPFPSEVNITEVLIKGGAKTFAGLISATGVLQSYDANIKSGLTVFAPTDGAFTAAVNKLLDRLSSEQKVSLLKFHALPSYTPLGTLKSTNGPVTTLASKYSLSVSSSGDTVTLNTNLSKATISSTILDDQPLAVFAVSAVLEPKELFGSAPSPSQPPVPKAPSPKAPSPKANTPKAPSPIPNTPKAPSPKPNSPKAKTPAATPAATQASTPSSSPNAPAGPTQSPANSESTPTSTSTALVPSRGLVAFLVACIGSFVFMI